MSEELDRLKAALAADGYQDDVYSKVDADVVIAHLEADLKESRQEAADVTILYEASHEYSRTLHAQLAECQERERKLRRYAAHHSECGAETNDTAFGNCTCGLSAALEVKK